MVFLFVIISGFALDLWGGFCIAHLWNWFIHPAFNLPMIRFSVGVGVMLIHDIISQYNMTALSMRIGNDPDTDDLMRNVILTGGSYLIVFIVGYIFHIMM